MNVQVEYSIEVFIKAIIIFTIIIYKLFYI